MELKEALDQVVAGHARVMRDLDREAAIQAAVDCREALVAASGCLATWTPVESTGRAPQDTVIVRRPESEANIDWDSPNNLPLDPETFGMLWQDALEVLGRKEQVFVTD
ncbi:MAG: phosphoenolpyruvate carboxykinase (ATP), partial [Desulfobacteraceae bacterium]